MLFRNIKKWIFLLISTSLINPVFFQYATAEPRISEAVFATSVKNHKPINQLDSLSNDLDKLYFFTDIRGYQGHTLTHQWTYNDWVVQSLPFTIKGHRWRVSSSKTLDKKMKGKWTVKILDSNGVVLQENSIAYTGTSSQTTPKEQQKTEVNKTQEQEETTQNNENKKSDDKKKSSKATLKTTENDDDGDEEDCDSDNSDQDTSNETEADALLTDDDFEQTTNTKEADAVAKMATTVIEQLEKMPENTTEKPE